VALFGKNITRRGLFKTAAVTGATAAAIHVLTGCSHPAEETIPNDPVVVEENSATTVLGEDGAYEYIEREFESRGEWELPLGNVLHEGEGTWLPVTTAGASAMPMVKCSAFSLTSGELTEVVPAPITPNSPNVVIYDARCSDQAYAWVELDTLTKDWSLYAAKFANGTLSGSPNTLWQGSSDWDPPRFAVTGNKVIWQVMPSLWGNKTSEMSHCYLWKTGSANATDVVESLGRFATAPSVSGDTVTLAPRVRNDEGTYYGITAYSLSDDMETIIDRLVMPENVRPFHAVRMGDVFALSVEASYGYGGLLGSMGTYIGTAEGSFASVPLEPFANIAGSKNGLFVVKSRASYYVVDYKNHGYTFLGAADRCVDYGEYPARVGQTDTFVTFSTIKSPDTGYPASVLVRAFAL
jgi:hypothetical protein